MRLQRGEMILPIREVQRLNQVPAWRRRLRILWLRATLPIVNPERTAMNDPEEQEPEPELPEGEVEWSRPDGIWPWSRH